MGDHLVCTCFMTVLWEDKPVAVYVQYYVGLHTYLPCYLSIATIALSKTWFRRKPLPIYMCINFPLQPLRDPGTWLQTILDSISKRWIKNAQLDLGGFTSLFNLIFTLYSYHNCATSKNLLDIFLNNTSFTI